MKSSEIPSSACWNCGKAVDAATPLESDADPVPHDVTLCIYCGEWNVFADDMMLRKPTEQEFIAIGMDPMARAARHVWATLPKPKA